MYALHFLRKHFYSDFTNYFLQGHAFGSFKNRLFLTLLGCLAYKVLCFDVLIKDVEQKKFFFFYWSDKGPLSFIMQSLGQSPI